MTARRSVNVWPLFAAMWAADELQRDIHHRDWFGVVLAALFIVFALWACVADRPASRAEADQ